MKHIRLKGHIYFITSITKDRNKIFVNDDVCELLLENMDNYRKELDYLIYSYVIMPDHFHWIIQPKEENLSLIMGRLKGRASFEINKKLNRKGALWQENYFEHIIRNQLDFKEKIDYMHNNPLRAALVSNLNEYKYSSYQNYYRGNEKLIRIDYPQFIVDRGRG